MSREHEPEDLAAFGILDELAHGAGREDTAPVPPPEGEDEALEVLRRLYLESLGLMAYELELVAPRPETKAALLATISGDETQEVPAPGSVTANPATGRNAGAPAPLGPFAPHIAGKTSPTSSPAARTDAPLPFRQPLGGQTAPRRWPVALAALFALAAIGLGIWAASLSSELSYRETQLRQLETRLAEADRTAAELAEARQELARLEERFTFVTSPATTVYALRPPAAGSLQPLARGHLFLAANRRDWRLEVRGLKQEPEAQDYQLWFIVDGLPMSGGVFDAKLGKAAQLADSAMPAGVQAVAVTLERKGGVPSPTSPILLIADQTVQL